MPKRRAIRSSGRKPLAFRRNAERAAATEAATDESILRSMRGILETTSRDYGHAVRSVHAKSHALLEGRLQVLDGLPPTLAQGLFAEPKDYPAVLRFSTNPGDILDDTVSTPRGLAVKIIGVEGERLPGATGGETQDFVLVNGPAFVAPDAASFAQSLKLLAATTDTGQSWKKMFSAALRGLARLGEDYGIDVGRLKALGGQPLTHPLGETFYSQTPFRYGAYVAKFAIAPVSPELTALTQAPVDLAGKPNGLRGAMIDFFTRHEAVWELRVQLRTHPETMPIEDASVPWPEAASPFVAVARLTVPAQPAWNEQRARAVDDAMAFSPWNGIAAHQPLGSVNRARRHAYALSASFRSQFNLCPIHHVAAAPGLSDAPPSLYGTTAGREGRRPHTPDARPGAWGQPLRPVARGVTAGAAGGLAAGMVMSVIAGVLRESHDDPRPRGGGVASYAGAWALGLLGGAVYGGLRPQRLARPVTGAGLGLAWHALAYGLGSLARPGSRASVAQQAMLHAASGAAAAFVAKQVEARLE